MAKRRKVLPARKARNGARDDDALLLRSAKTLGRMIGALQRQLDEATRRVSANGAQGNNGAAKKKRSTKPRAAAAVSRKRRPRAAASRKTARPR